MLVVVLCLLSVALAQFPPAGLYVTLRNDALYNITELVSLQLSDAANTFQGTPQQSGTTSGVTYVLNGFIYDINLQHPTVFSSGKNFLTALMIKLKARTKLAYYGILSILLFKYNKFPL